MKRFLTCILALTFALAYSACATTSASRELASGRPGAAPVRPATPPAPATHSSPRTTGTVMGSHPSHNPPPSGPVLAQHAPPAPAHNDDTHKVTITNPNTGKDEVHHVVVDNRPPSVVDHDPHSRIVVRNNNYHPEHDWTHFHPVIVSGYPNAWWGVWGIQSWDSVGTVTCEAVNETTGGFYPVTMDRDSIGWSDDAVNTVLDTALEDCMDDPIMQLSADGVSPCIAATPSCSFQPYVVTYSPN